MANLLNQANKILAFTTKLVGAINSNSMGNNIPTNAVMRALDITEALGVESIADVKRTINELKQATAKVANLARCGWAVTFGGQFGGLMENILTGLTGAALSVVDQIWDAVYVQIKGLVDQSLGTILNLIDAFQSLITSILLLADSVKNFFASLSEFADLQVELEMEYEDCKKLYSSLAACLLNKYLGKYIDQFTNKAVGFINKTGAELNAALYEDLQDVNVFASYAKKEAFLLKKASLQINGLTPTNLLAD